MSAFPEAGQGNCLPTYFYHFPMSQEDKYRDKIEFQKMGYIKTLFTVQNGPQFTNLK